MILSNNIKQTPKKFNEEDVIARAAAHDLLERLDWLTLKPEKIQVLGWGGDDLTSELAVKYPDAEITFSAEASDNVDLLIANLVFPWQVDYQALLKQWQQRLRKEGVLLLSALGPDTLKECQTELTRIPVCIDMHDIGDAMQALGFSDPVLEVQHYTLDYSSKDKLWQELTAHRLWVNAHDKIELRISTLTFELIYAHAFCAEAQQKNRQGETVISLADMRAKLSESMC